MRGPFSVTFVNLYAALGKIMPNNSLASTSRAGTLSREILHPSLVTTGYASMDNEIRKSIVDLVYSIFERKVTQNKN